MPELQFKGKEFVYNHHLTVPFRPLEMDANKSIGKPNLNHNLIIHGDNLHALKALLPIYAGKVDCIFIDPPYNTGNEGWCYNDNVNSQMMKEWLSSNPVTIEDGLRHDKWCAMMYPRLKLLYELLADTGSLWMTLDDNEVHHARAILNEVFDESNFVATVVWQKKQSPQSDATNLSDMHDYVIAYAKQAKRNSTDPAGWQRNLVSMSEGQIARYSNPDNDLRGPWTDTDYTCNKTADERVNLYYPIKNPHTGKDVWPDRTRVWAFDPNGHKQNVKENLIWWPEGRSKPRFKKFYDPDDVGAVPTTWWPRELAGDNQESRRELRSIMANVEHDFSTPKPTRLIGRILDIAAGPEAIVLDSFAGSGTTAHAVLKANRTDGGARRFILVECEDYAQKLTAERVKRVIQGYAFDGTSSEELYRATITYNSFKNAEKLLKSVEAIDNLDGHRFDRIKKEVANGELIVTGETKVKTQTEGLGGEFTFCTLGESLDLDKILTGKSLPDYATLGAWLFHTATGEALNTSQMHEGIWYVGESVAYHVWLVYKSDLDFLKSNKAALTLELAETIANDSDRK